MYNKTFICKEKEGTMKDIMTVAVVNFKVDACNKEGNLSRICGYAEAAAKRGGRTTA